MYKLILKSTLMRKGRMSKRQPGTGLRVILMALIAAAVVGLVAWKISQTSTNRQTQPSTTQNRDGGTETKTYANDKFGWSYTYELNTVSTPVKIFENESKSEVNFASGQVTKPLDSRDGYWFSVRVSQVEGADFDKCYPKDTLEQPGFEKLPGRNTEIAKKPTKLYRAVQKNALTDKVQRPEISYSAYYNAYSVPHQGRCYNLIQITTDAKAGEAADDPVLYGFGFL